MATNDSAAVFPRGLLSTAAAQRAGAAWRRVVRRRPALIGAGVRRDFAEPFRLLALTIEQLRAEEGIRCLLVLSAGRGEGRTTSVANLGIALAERGKQVTLVAGDGSIALPHLFGLDLTSGGRDQSYGVYATGFKGLSILCPEPGAHVGQAWRNLLADESGAPDLVLVDAPAAAEEATAFGLATQVDGVLYVVRRRPQDVHRQREILAHLNRLGTRLLGVIYNEG